MAKPSLYELVNGTQKTGSRPKPTLASIVMAGFGNQPAQTAEKPPVTGASTDSFYARTGGGPVTPAPKVPQTPLTAAQLQRNVSSFMPAPTEPGQPAINLPRSTAEQRAAQERPPVPSSMPASTARPPENYQMFRGAGAGASFGKPGGGKWLGDNTMAAVSGLNKSAAQTLDWVLPDVITPGFLQEGMDYYKDLGDSYAQRAARTNQEADTQLLGELYQGTVAAVPNAVLAYLTGGGSLAGQAGATAGGRIASLARTAANTLETLARNLAFHSSFIRVVGPTYEDAKADGANELEAQTTAILNAFMNATVEVGGGVETAAAAAPTVRNWVKSMLEEGKEEVVQGVIENLVKKVIYDDDREWASDTDPDAVLNSQRAGREFLGGATVGGVLGGGQMAINRALGGGNPNVRGVLQQDEASGQTTETASTEPRLPYGPAYTAGLDGFVKYEGKEIQNIQSQRNEIATGLQSVKNFISRAAQRADNMFKRLYMGKVTPQIVQSIQQAAGINLEGYNVTLTNDTIRKILKDHGDMKTELPRGQIPVTEALIEQIPNILAYPDAIYNAGQTQDGKPVIRFEKWIDGCAVVVEYVSDKHKNLDTKTFYIINKKKPVTAPDAQRAPAPTSEAFSDTVSSDPNVPQGGTEVNTQSAQNIEEETGAFGTDTVGAARVNPESYGRLNFVRQILGLQPGQEVSSSQAEQALKDPILRGNLERAGVKIEGTRAQQRQIVKNALMGVENQGQPGYNEAGGVENAGSEAAGRDQSVLWDELRQQRPNGETEAGLEGDDGTDAERASRGRGAGERRTRQVGKRTYSYQETPAEQRTPLAAQTSDELAALGVESFVYDGELRADRDGVSSVAQGEASTLLDGSVGVKNTAVGTARNIAGHEALHSHVLRGNSKAKRFAKMAIGAFNFSSPHAADYLHKIAQGYYGEDYDLFKDYPGINRELAAFIAGKAHDGTFEDMAGMLNNPEAVQAAWEALVADVSQQNKQGTAAPEESSAAAVPCLFCCDTSATRASHAACTASGLFSIPAISSKVPS